MFLESNYKPKDNQMYSELSIMDVAILTAQIGDRPFLKKRLKEHLTAGQIQIVCFYAQGTHIAKTGRSLFKENFYIVNDRIENPLVTEVFGDYNKVVTPFTMDKSLEKYLTSRDKGFTPENNKMTQEIIYEHATDDYKQFMEELRQTALFKNASNDEFKKVSKKDIKDYFEQKIIGKTEIFNLIIGE